MDLDGNKERIIEAVEQAKKQNARLVITPELSITGYSCLDTFTEHDLEIEALEVLAELLTDARTRDIVVDVGLPISHHSVRYNCRVVFHNGKILLIRPKQSLANDGNFREARYFTAWQRPQQWEHYRLPPFLRSVTGQNEAIFGDAVLQFDDALVGIESCEELFTPYSPHTDMGMDGVEILANSSGSHHELRKLDQRVELIVRATKNSNAVYLYSNQIGNGGDRMNFDGCSCIVQDGRLIAQGEQFSLCRIDMVVATVDLADIQVARSGASRGAQAQKAPRWHRVHCEHISICQPSGGSLIKPTAEKKWRYYTPEEEIAYGPAMWCWGYLARSRQSGFFLPLSGGVDSCATSLIIFSMCRMAFQRIQSGDTHVLADARSIAGDAEWTPTSAQDICGRIMHTAFLGTSNSSSETRSRAKTLAADIGSFHLDFNVDTIVSAFTAIVTTVLGVVLKYKTQGGTDTSNLALQNIQSRSRMVVAYLFAAVLPSFRQQKGERSRGGALLVLGSANVDEQLRGYYTKYDNSSADINPIGGISKTDLRRFIGWARSAFELPVLTGFLDATPSAELIPFTSDSDAGVQSDEAEMGFTYDELSWFGRMRKSLHKGAYGQWLELVRARPTAPPRELYQKVERFNHFFGINRHKMSTVTPAVHCCDYSPEDNRFDLRPMLYPRLTWSYRKIERHVEQLEKAQNGDAGGVD